MYRRSSDSEGTTDEDRKSNLLIPDSGGEKNLKKMGQVYFELLNVPLCVLSPKSETA